MITDADITKLKKSFVTKEEFHEELADVHVELGELHDKFDNLNEKFDVFGVKLDKIIGGLENERLENAAGAVHLVRHDRQIEALALAANITLPD